ncbi:hypothetical protein Misp01_37660 [Microtetraspora sp. NBRC 13810]|uniref:hypothetical protein n=1 Tax=Microtetraspora sp. NBRC 13810 TaxID=3030990 RepID=UPI0024A4AB4E|nr:hypothetical protein [Microtetraspora sp. NBRC 13810]GLW08636.1 hypothetical protein Misp01_37660 [Microtetraspora sp. NBRC 13810]
MREGFSTQEKWPFGCQHCWFVWEDDYEVHRRSDGHGNDVTMWYRSGVPVQPPWSGVLCPRCGDIGVKSFPSGYLRRHAELLSLPVTAARFPLEQGTARATRDARRHGVFFPVYAALATALVLLMGLEIFEFATRTIH